VVKFCPRCGGPMMPTKKNGEVFFKCNKCGYEVKATKKDLEKYGMKYQVESSKRVVTAKATESKASGLTPEEREMLHGVLRDISRGVCRGRRRERGE